MNFEAIDFAREAAGISQYRLCHTAGVHPTTYSRLRKRPGVAKWRTINRLEKALQSLLVPKTTEAGNDTAA